MWSKEGETMKAADFMCIFFVIFYLIVINLSYIVIYSFPKIHFIRQKSFRLFGKTTAH